MLRFSVLAMLLIPGSFLPIATLSPTLSAGEKTPKLEWEDLFKNLKLTDWEGLEEHWKLGQDGLTGSNLNKRLSFRTFLCSKKKYGDFEIRFQVRVIGPNGMGNSGFNFRSEILDRKKFTVSGPQADIGQQVWGALSSEFIPGKPSVAIKSAPAAVLAKVKQNEFNDYHIKCVGKHVTIKLNGEVTVDDDFPWMAKDGIIAWQVHINPTEVTFRNIQIKAVGSGGAGTLPTIILKDDEPKKEKK
jgi:hypothetical protein